MVVLGGISLVSIAVAVWLLYYVHTINIDVTVSIETMDEFREKMQEFDYLEKIGEDKNVG